MKKQLLILLTIALFSQSFTFAQNSEYVLFFDNTTEGQSLKYSDDATTSAMDGATDYTIEMWVKPNDNSAKYDIWLYMRDMFKVVNYDNNRFYFQHIDNGTNTYYNVNNDALTPNDWNHIAIICNSSDGANGSVKLYVNGVDVTVQNYDAKALIGGAGNNDVFVGYGSNNSGGSVYANMHAREIRIKKTAETVANLHVDLADNNYDTDADTTVLFHFAEGSGTTTVNSATGTDATLGFSDAHYPTWVTLSSTLSVGDNNTTDFSVFPNPVVDDYFTIQARSNETLLEVELLDILGKSVKKIEFGTSITAKNINVDKLNSGLYIVKIKTNAGVGTKKIVIK